MPKLNDLYPSKFLKAGDAEDGDLVLTIRCVKVEEVGQGDQAEDKPVLYFEETDKGLVLNKTNGATFGKLLGNDTDDWTGKKVALFSTEVQFGSEMVLALRVRLKAPRATLPRIAPKPKVMSQQEADDAGQGDDADIPF